MKRLLLVLTWFCCCAIALSTEIENRASLVTVVQQVRQSFEKTSTGEYRAAPVRSAAKFSFSASGVTTVQSGIDQLKVVAKELGRQGYAGTMPIGSPNAISSSEDRFGWPTLELKRSGISEHYVNGRVGMRHAFHILSRPVGETGNAFVKIAVSGANKIESSGKTALRFQVGGSSFRYSELTVWDAKNRRLAAKLVPAKDGFFISVDDRNATYPVTIDPDWSFSQRLTHPTDPYHDTLFGAAVAIDGFTVAVGAPGDEEGKVYIFVYNGASWVSQQVIQQSDLSVMLPFGQAVSLYGNRLAVGAGNTAFMFERTGTTWNQVAQFSASADDPYSNFAADNRYFKLIDNRLIVAAPDYLNTGKLYVFAPVAGVWQETFSVVGAAGQNLGKSMGFDGNRVVALGTGNNITVFDAGATTLTFASTVPIPAGWKSVDISGNRIAVGYSSEGDGVIRIYTQSGGTFALSQTIISPYDGPPEDVDLGGGEMGQRDWFGFGGYVDLMGNVLGSDIYRLYTAPGDYVTEGQALLFRITDTTAAFTDRLGFGFYAYRGQVPLFHLQSGQMIAGLWQDLLTDFQDLSAADIFTSSAGGLSVTFGVVYEVGGKNVTGTITLAEPAPAGGARVNLMTTSPNMTVPTVVTVPAGATSATFTATTLPVATDGFVDVMATSEVSGNFRTAFEVRSPRVGSLSTSATELAPGGTVNLTFTLQAVAGPGGVPVTLTSSNPAGVTIPTSMVVPQGQSRLVVPVQFSNSLPSGPISLTAGPSYREKTVTINVVKRNLTYIVVNQTLLKTSESTTGRVELDGPAPAGGQIVKLTSDSPELSVPSTVTIPAGVHYVEFPITSVGLTAQITYIRAGISTLTLRQWIRIEARRLATIAVSPNVVTGGKTANLILTVDYPAPQGGMIINLKSQKQTLASVPATATVPAGAMSVSVPVTTVARNSDPIEFYIYGNLTGQGTKGAKIRIVRPVVSTVTISPSTVIGGNTATGTVTLSGPAAAGGLVVKLSSQKPTIGAVPATVTVPAGATSVTFPITTVPRTGAPITFNIYASIGADSVKAAVLTVTAP
ncbi:FG-GAP repeat [Fimbriimonadaceae bacterium]